MTDDYAEHLLAEKDAEIERLRADLLTRDGQAQELQGEVARLRELLREAMACGSILPVSHPDGPSGQDWPFDLYERVREALDRD